MVRRNAPPRPSLRRRVLRAATAEFSAAGFAAARLDPIAAGAGVDLGTIRRLLGDKDELYATVLLDVLAEAISDLLLDGVRPHDRKSRHAATGGER
ncbi:MAG: TetR/AcrR family transcriptional regulator [Thermoanaerobaculia bacterium]